MICKSCGGKNNEDNKFCINCGDEIILQNEINSNYCPQCGTENNSGNNFCIKCGNKLSRQTEIISSKKKKIKRNSISKPGRQNAGDKRKNKPDLNSIKIFWITTAVIIAAVIIPTSIIPLLNQTSQGNEFKTGLENFNPVIEAKVMEIASKFVCSCGSCGAESLEICKCERAKEERNFIRTQLEQNQELNDIVISVANTYGWMKPEFASVFNIDPSKVWESGNNLISKDIIPNERMSINSKSVPWNKVCPVRGEEVDPNVKTVVFDDKVYGFCCSGCDKEFLTNPDKFSRQLSEDGKMFDKG